MNIESFTQARYGMFIHFGLYSHMGRGEWVMNREAITPEELRKIAETFDPTEFNAGEIADLAVAAGMRYIVFTTMHHEGFRMYETELSDFSSATYCGRDFVREITEAARERGLGIGLYHSLNNWFDQPDAVAALESPEAYTQFIANTHRRIEELMTRYQPIDILWYDGWWPFNAEGWQAEAMNEMARRIQPGVIMNGRNGLPGDFATPEQHLSAPEPWRPWEACLTLNDNWGFHAGDQNWKSVQEVIKNLVRVAQGRGNLLLNIGPDGKGRVPEATQKVLLEVGQWLKRNSEAIFDTELWTLDPYKRGEHRGDWNNHGLFTVKGNDLYFIGTSLPPDEATIVGLEAEVLSIEELGAGSLAFEQKDERLRITIPCAPAEAIHPRTFRIRCDRPATIYRTGGLRVPECDHPRYDPIQSDISW